ncbi:hypothetical protein N431DRAFT_428127 [Stipitochalara longipes BDJ]|nr:hypothetical protein N431DRAFT_428127 [Stipitochalara longipes BDJ]
MSDSREPASTNIPEWRRTATPSGKSLSTKQLARRPKDTARWKNHRFIRELPRETQDSNSWLQPTGPTPEISLESLGTDLWFLISAHAPKSTLLSICQTSPSLHTQVIPVLYHTIDFSTHTPPEGVTISFRGRRKIYEGQYLFVRQISLMPEYGQYVRSLKWTIGVENEQVWSVALDNSGFRAPTSSHGERVVWSSGNVGKLFERLTEVVNLDIECANGVGVAMTVSEGKDLFPAVQKVNLGATSDASYFLSGAGIMPLSVLNLGPYLAGRPDFSGLTHNANSSRSTIRSKSKKYPDILHPSFQLRCKGLHTLSVTLQHLDVRSEVRDFYAALATFILDIRPRSFIFNLVGMNGKPLLQPMSPLLRHKGDTCPHCHGAMVVGPNGALTHWHSLSTVTMTNVIPEHFQVELLPVLMTGWEGLQRVEVRGVMKMLLVDMRKELSGRGIMLAGDGWETEWIEE